jgi:hypothetical protein
MPAISSSILTRQAGIDWSVIRKIHADKVLVSSGRRGKWKTLQLAVVELVDALRTSSSSTSLTSRHHLKDNSTRYLPEG